jgi:signal transduction histidine kinase
LSTDEEDNLLRICQEALTNVLRHSQATRITISITFESVKVLLSIADNGCGYSEDTVKYGYGVNNMRERAAAIGGSLLVKSISGSGTEIVVTVPAAK